MSIKKKTKRKPKAAAKKPTVEKSAAKKNKGKDIVQVRENINELVKESAEEIATSVITAAKSGQLATAKYLFEAVGLYPPTEQTAAAVPLKDTLAHTLLTRMGIPTEPVNHGEEDESDAVLTSKENGVKAPAGAAASAESESGEEREDEQPPPPTDGER